MAQHKSAKKRIRRNARRDVINSARRGRIRTFITKVELAIVGGKKDEAAAALKAAQPEIQRGVTKGVVLVGGADRRPPALRKALGRARQALRQGDRLLLPAPGVDAGQAIPPLQALVGEDLPRLTGRRALDRSGELPI